MSNEGNSSPSIKLELSVDETNLVIEALAQMPFARVHALIASIRELGQAQLRDAAAGARAAATNGAANGQAEAGSRSQLAQ